MGRLIEESRVVEILQQTWLSGTIAFRFIDDIKRRIRVEVPTVEAIPKADYETRLKSDLIAILEEIDLEFEELTMNTCEFDVGLGYRNIIKQKINALKENKNGDVNLF